MERYWYKLLHFVCNHSAECFWPDGFNIYGQPPVQYTLGPLHVYIDVRATWLYVFNHMLYVW